MANKLEVSSCLSSERHDHDITNPLLHFLGCIEICERQDFLHGNTRIWEDELEHQRNLQGQNADETVENMKKGWKSNIESEMRRIATLRHALSSDEQDKHLVKDVEESGQSWRMSEEYKSNIDRVKEWRGNATQSISEPEFTSPARAYSPEEDTSVPVIQFKAGRGFSETCDDRLSGKFPNQKTTVKKLLEVSDQKANLLHNNRDFDNNHIKYFHIPTNNMKWAEEAIARYYGESSPGLDEMQRHLRRPPKSDASIVLQDRYWRGQLHGDVSLPPHARYMSPICETISSPGKKLNEQLKNIVLFMPYLHWETSKRREEFAHEIDNIVSQTARDHAKKEADAKMSRQQSRRLLPSAAAENQIQISHKHGVEPKNLGPIESIADAVQRYQNKIPSSFQSEHALGHYLLAAARLYEGITTYRDRKLLREYLPKGPSIHPRRTLDQAYYWTLKSTKMRDRDQVIYRGTTATRDAFHHFDEENNEWPEHKELEGGVCPHCSTNIRKVSRVIMVDQLWMWILDAKTLITCFLKRYGANKQDYSGVHKSIRTRLEDPGSESIRTVFELAIIVLDECTTTLFDRTKSLDRRPQVIDEFSKAIGKIAHKQGVAFDRLWRWTDEARKFFRSQGYVNPRKLHLPLLDINPEGKLEREIEDIIEELDIMLRILSTHQDIIKSFIEQSEGILDPNGDFLQKLRNHESVQEASRKEKYEDYQCFKLRANDCQNRVNIQVKELECLRKSARNTSDDVLHLLTMKQQQASVVQAWQAVKQSDETIKQGRSIMVFTLATIVFLPLSFITSVFGMNNREFGDNQWILAEQLQYIFLISAGVVSVSLFFAFSAWTRAFIWSYCSKTSTKFATSSGAYEYISRRQKPDDIFEHTYKEIHRIKIDAKKEALKKRINKKMAQEKDTPQDTTRQIVDKTQHSTEGLCNSSDTDKGPSSRSGLPGLLSFFGYRRHRDDATV
ncbi:hypothetical protein F4808DRAFT_299052 [Astrocystis sublimbata]|nr:hypothetical protein F4808DRAFT_299052 [Astrocystis sublimbata]